MCRRGKAIPSIKLYTIANQKKVKKRIYRSFLEKIWMLKSFGKTISFSTTLELKNLFG